MDEPGKHYAKKKKPVGEDHTPSYECLAQAYPLRQKVNWWLPRARGNGKKWNDSKGVLGFSLG